VKLGRSGRRRAAAAAAPGQHSRGGAMFGKGKGPAEQYAAHIASVCPRGDATRAHWLGERAEAQVR
jgi:hypothetical protein